MIGLAIRPGLGAIRCTAQGVLPPTGPAALPFTPAARWHAGFSDVTQAGGRVLSASDLQGLAAVTQGAPGIGPMTLTDGLGQKFWRFTGAEYLEVATSLVTDQRNTTALAVVRVPRVPNANVILGQGARSAGTQANTNGTLMQVRITNQDAGYLWGYNRRGDLAANHQWFVPGAQKQVMAVTSAADGVRLCLNEQVTASLGSALSATGIQGAEIGRYPYSPGSSGGWGQFDLYEMVIFNSALSAAQMQAVSEALMAAHDILPVEHQLVLEGDSIMQGTGAVIPALSASAVLTDPGAGLLPGNWRVINKAGSGNTLSNLLSRRDDNRGWATAILPGRNVLAVEIGRNNLHLIGAAQHRSDMVAYLNTPSTGVLQRGWEVRVMANIAAAASIMTELVPYRAMLRDPAFLTDTQSAAGQPYEGRVSVISTDLIQHLGQTIFEDSTDAANTAYYSNDITHPDILGARLRMSGGDTPQYGVTAGL